MFLSDIQEVHEVMKDFVYFLIFIKQCTNSGICQYVEELPEVDVVKEYYRCNPTE